MVTRRDCAPLGHSLSAILRNAISLYLVRGIPIKLATNIHHVIGNCWKGFQGQKSKVKSWPDELTCDDEAYSTFRRRRVEPHLLVINNIRPQKLVWSLNKFQNDGKKFCLYSTVVQWIRLCFDTSLWLTAQCCVLRRRWLNEIYDKLRRHCAVAWCDGDTVSTW